MPSSHLVLRRPLFLLPPVRPSIRVFSSESTLRMRWPKYWSFSFSIIPSKEHPGLISFRMDWLDLAVQGTLKILLQHHISKASIIWLLPGSHWIQPTSTPLQDQRGYITKSQAGFGFGESAAPGLQMATFSLCASRTFSQCLGVEQE